MGNCAKSVHHHQLAGTSITHLTPQEIAALQKLKATNETRFKDIVNRLSKADAECCNTTEMPNSNSNIHRRLQSDGGPIKEKLNATQGDMIGTRGRAETQMSIPQKQPIIIHTSHPLLQNQGINRTSEQTLPRIKIKSDNGVVSMRNSNQSDRSLRMSINAGARSPLVRWDSQNSERKTINVDVFEDIINEVNSDISDEQRSNLRHRHSNGSSTLGKLNKQWLDLMLEEYEKYLMRKYPRLLMLTQHLLIPYRRLAVSTLFDSCQEALHAYSREELFQRITKDVQALAIRHLEVVKQDLEKGIVNRRGGDPGSMLVAKGQRSEVSKVVQQVRLEKKSFLREKYGQYWQRVQLNLKSVAQVYQFA